MTRLRIATKDDFRAALAGLSAPMQRLLLELGHERHGMPAGLPHHGTRSALYERGLIEFVRTDVRRIILTAWGLSVLKELRRQRRAWAKSLQAEIQAGVVS